MSVSVTTVANSLKGNPNVSDTLRQKIIAEAERLGYKPNYNARALVKNGITIGYLAAEEPHEHMEYFLKGVNEGIRKMSDFKVELKAFTFRDNTSDMEARDCALRMTKETLDGLILSTSFDNSGYMDIVKEYITSNQLPMIYMDDSVPDMPYIASLSVDSKIVGKIVAQLTYLLCGKKAKIGVISSSPKFHSHVNILEALTEDCGKYGVEIMKILYNHDNQSETYSCADRLVSEYPELDLIYVTSFNTIPVCKCLENKGLSGKIKVVGHDVYRELVPYIRNGQQIATIYQNPQQVGIMCVDMLVRAIIGGEKPPKKKYAVRPEIVLASNLEVYTKDL